MRCNICDPVSEFPPGNFLPLKTYNPCGVISTSKYTALKASLLVGGLGSLYSQYSLRQAKNIGHVETENLKPLLGALGSRSPLSGLVFSGASVRSSWLSRL